VLQSLTGNLTVNTGRPGAQTPTILSIYDAVKISMNFTDLVILGGVNDIINNPPGQATEAIIESNLQYIWQDAQSRGMHVYALTLTPFGGYTYYNNDTQAELVNVNAWINATAPTLGVTVVDTYTVLADPINLDYLQSIYDSGDHLHPSQAGINEIATLVAAALS
jgi:lysophospholipase L1-like esterase